MSRQQDINDNKRQYLQHPCPNPNTIKINTHNTLQHEIMKAVVVYCLKKRGFEIFTEVPWANGSGIPDVFIADIPAYVEILCSETDKSLKRKTAEYPAITQIVVRVEDFFNSERNEELISMFNKLKSEYLP